MDRLSDDPPNHIGNLRHNDRVTVDGPQADPATREEEERVLGNGTPPAGSTAIDEPRLPHTATKPTAPEESEEQTRPADGGHIAGRLASDGAGNQSIHTDTGSGSNNLTGSATR